MKNNNYTYSSKSLTTFSMENKRIQQIMHKTRPTKVCTVLPNDKQIIQVFLLAYSNFFFGRKDQQ